MGFSKVPVAILVKPLSIVEILLEYFRDLKITFLKEHLGNSKLSKADDSSSIYWKLTENKFETNIIHVSYSFKCIRHGIKGFTTLFKTRAWINTTMKNFVHVISFVCAILLKPMWPLVTCLQGKLGEA